MRSSARRATPLHVLDCARGLRFPTSAIPARAAPARWSSSPGEIESLRPDAPALTDRDRAKTPRARLPGAAAQRLRDQDAHRSGGSRRAVRRARRARRWYRRGTSRMTFANSHSSCRTASHSCPVSMPCCTCLGVPTVRAYSMSNIDRRTSLWQFQIKRVPSGLATSVLFDRLRGWSGSRHRRSVRPRISAHRRASRHRLHCRRIGDRADRFDCPRRCRRCIACQPSPVRVLRRPAAGRHLRRRRARRSATVGRPVQLHPGHLVSRRRGVRGWTGLTGFVHEVVSATLCASLCQNSSITLLVRRR